MGKVHMMANLCFFNFIFLAGQSSKASTSGREASQAVQATPCMFLGLSAVSRRKAWLFNVLPPRVAV